MWVMSLLGEGRTGFLIRVFVRVWRQLAGSAPSSQVPLSSSSPPGSSGGGLAVEDRRRASAGEI